MTNWLSPFFDPAAWTTVWHPAVDLIGWGLLHAVWQGTLVAIALAGALRLLHRHTPPVRYAVSTAALVLLVALPVATVWWTASSPAPVPPTPTAAEFAPLPMAQTPPAAAAPSFLQAPLATAESAARAALPWLVALWACGVGVLTLRLSGGAWQVRRLRTTSTRASAEAQATLNELADSLGLRRAVSLRRSERISAPMVLGWLRPVILVPTGVLAGLPPAQVEALLLHELAHVRRHDVLVGWLQAAVETLLFFHPAAWWISRQIRREREACCDDLAVHRGADRLTVARALAALAERQVADQQATPPFAPAATDGPLLSRIRRLVQPSAPVDGWRARVSMTVAGALLCALPLLLAACASSGSTEDPTASETSSDREVLIVEQESVTGSPDSTHTVILNGDTLRVADSERTREIVRLQSNLRFAPDDSVEVRVFKRSFSDSLDDALHDIIVSEDDIMELRRLAEPSDSLIARLNRTMPSPDSLAAWTRRAMPHPDSLDAWVRRAMPSQDSLDLWIRRYTHIPDSLGEIDYRFDGTVRIDTLRGEDREVWLRHLREEHARDQARLERDLDRLRQHREEARRDREALLFELRRMASEGDTPDRLRERAEQLRREAERLEEKARKMAEEEGGS